MVQVSIKLLAGDQARADDFNLLANNLNLRAEAQSSPNMTVKVKAGQALFGGSTRVEKSADFNSPTFVAPTVNPRIDLLVMNSSGTASIVTGTEAASPSLPTIPSDKLCICAVYLRVGTTAIHNTDQGSHGYIYQDMRPAWKVDLGNQYITRFASEDLTIGQPVGISNYWGGVARANRVTEINTSSNTADNTLDKQSRSFPIGGDKFVMLNSVGSSLYAVVCSIDPDTKEITKGTESAMTTDLNTTYKAYAGCKLGTDKFIVFCRENASTTAIRYRVATVSGTTITWGTAANLISESSFEYLCADQLGTDKGVVVQGHPSGPAKVIAFTVATTTATAGAAVAIDTAMDINPLVVKKVATDKFILASADDTGGGGSVQIGTVSTVTITLGTKASFSSSVDANDYQYFDIVSPADNVAVITFKANGSASGRMRACTISGTTPTFGTEVTDVTGSDGLRGIVAESSSSLLILDVSVDGLIKYTLSGTTLTRVGYVVQKLGSPAHRLIYIDNGYPITVAWAVTTITNWIKGMANNFIGIIQSTVNNGDSSLVLTVGVDTNQSSLIAGGTYQVSNGALVFISSGATIDSPNEEYVKAVSDTEIAI